MILVMLMIMAFGPYCRVLPEELRADQFAVEREHSLHCTWQCGMQWIPGIRAATVNPEAHHKPSEWGTSDGRRVENRDNVQVWDGLGHVGEVDDVVDHQIRSQEVLQSVCKQV